MTTLFDRLSRAPVPATLRFGPTAEEILAVEAVWGPWRTAAVERLVQSGFPEDAMPQHWHWDWAHKVPKLGLVAYQGVGVECDGAMQGLMLIAAAVGVSLAEGFTAGWGSIPSRKRKPSTRPPVG